jgi:hypothetical protein
LLPNSPLGLVQDSAPGVSNTSVAMFADVTANSIHRFGDTCLIVASNVFGHGRADHIPTGAAARAGEAIELFR